MAKRTLKEPEKLRLEHIGVRLSEGEVAKLSEIQRALQALSHPGMADVTPSVALRWVLHQAQVPTPPASAPPSTGT
jgi:hypothetical protein